MNSSFDFLLKPKRPTLEEFEFWEKTVEWAFVRKYLSFSLIGAPLGGKMETAGDALLQSLVSDRFCLLEFKRRDVHFSSECEKYPVFGHKKWFELEQHRKDAYVKNFHDLYTTYGVNGDAPHVFVYGIVKASTLGDELKQALDVAVSQHYAGMFSVTKTFLASAFKLVRNEEKDKRKTVVVEAAGMRYWGTVGRQSGSGAIHG